MKERWISDEMIDEARRTVRIPWSPDGEMVYLQAYARQKHDGSMEDWYETCARVVNGNCNFVPPEFIEPGEPEKLYQMLLTMQLIPGGRHIRATGIEEDKQFINNCFTADFTERFSEHFEYTLLRLMEGGGVGANYSNRYINSRPGGKPWIPLREIELHLVCRENHPDYDRRVDIGNPGIPEEWEGAEWLKVGEYNGEEMYTPVIPFCNLLSKKYSPYYRPMESARGKEIMHVVTDSREGWGDVLRHLLDMYMDESLPKGKPITFIVDLSQVRPFGEKLSTFGGSASGPSALAAMLLRTNRLLNSRVGQPLNSIDTMTIDHYIGICVVSGGTRRSARMSMKWWNDPDIMDFITSKRQKFRGVLAHQTTNISVVVSNNFVREVKKGNPRALAVWNAFLDSAYTNGEPGLINATRHLDGEAPSAEFFSTNPCVVAGGNVLTDSGMRKVGSLVGQPFRAVIDGYHDSQGFFQSRKAAETICVRLTDGTEITLTDDHLVMTDAGWEPAGWLQPGTMIALGMGDTSGVDVLPLITKVLEKESGEPEDWLECTVSDERFLWKEKPQAVEIKAILNSLGVPSQLRYNKNGSCYSIRIHRKDLEYLSYLKKVLKQAKSQPETRPRKPPTIKPMRFFVPVESVEYVGVEPVYDCKVEGKNAFLYEGVVVHNCGEIGMVRYPDLPCFDVCCLGHVNLPFAENLEEAFRLMTRFLLRATFSPATKGRTHENVVRNRRIGVGFLGYQIWLIKNKIAYSQAPGEKFVTDSLSRWYDIVRSEARRYASQMRVVEPIKVTTVAPTGTVSRLCGVSAGIEPIIMPYYIRRYRMRTDSPVYLGHILAKLWLSLDEHKQNLLIESVQQNHGLEQLLGDMLSTISADVDTDAISIPKLAEYAAVALADLEQWQHEVYHNSIQEFERIANDPNTVALRVYTVDASIAIARHLLQGRNGKNGKNGNNDDIDEMIRNLMESQYSLSIEDILENQMAIQQFYADNAISVTCNFDPEKYTMEQLGQVLLRYLPHLKGLTVFPKTSIAQAPFEPVDYSVILERKRRGLPVSEVAEESECATGACPI